MKIIFQAKNKYLIRFDRGEEIIKKLKDFCSVFRSRLRTCLVKQVKKEGGRICPPLAPFGA